MGQISHAEFIRLLGSPVWIRPYDSHKKTVMFNLLVIDCLSIGRNYKQ